MGIANFLAVAEWILFCRLVLGETFASFSKRRLFFCFGALFLLLLQSIYSAGFYFPLLMLLILLLVFHLKLWEGIRVWLVTFLVISILEMGIGHFLKSFIGGVSAQAEQILCEGILVIFFLGYDLLAIEKPIRQVEQLSNLVWGIIVSILLAVEIMMAYFLGNMQDAADYGDVKTGAVVVGIGIMGICGMVFLCFYLLHFAQKYRLQNEFAGKYNLQQKEYFMRLLEKEQDTRQFRHDINNHLVSMQGLAERKEYDALKAYIGELLSEIHTISRRQYDVGNDIVNTIINYYFLPIREECDIHVSGYMGDAEGILQSDLCILISNLVKNAVEGVGRVENGERKIVFSVNRGTQYINIRIENTMAQAEERRAGEWPKTIKEDKRNHGMGIRNVRKTVEKYGGNFEVSAENGRFLAEVYVRG